MPSLNPFLDVDRELARRVTNYLAGQHVPALRAIQVEALNGAVTLRGTVKTFYEKQLTHHSASRVAGVRQVIDEIQVTWPSKFQTHLRSTTQKRPTTDTSVVQITFPLPSPADFSPARRHSADHPTG